MKTLKSYLSEIYWLIAILYYWSLTALAVNWFAILLLMILGLLLVTKNKIFGMTISIFLILINLYLLSALASELSEFEVFDADAKKLLGVGVLFIGLNLLFSILMLLKYALLPSKKLINLPNESDL
jgi:hypothetical protein